MSLRLCLNMDKQIQTVLAEKEAVAHAVFLP